MIIMIMLLLPVLRSRVGEEPQAATSTGSLSEPHWQPEVASATGTGSSEVSSFSLPQAGLFQIFMSTSGTVQ